jgi:hypothetical protein
MKKMFNEGNQIHNFMSSSGSGTVINYGSGSGSDFLTSYGSCSGSGSTSQKVTVPTVPVPQHWCCGFGSVRVWTSRIRIRQYLTDPDLDTSNIKQKSKKNLDSYRTVL